eukprot:12404948-Karenia_brevis.AAC.1
MVDGKRALEVSSGKLPGGEITASGSGREPLLSQDKISDRASRRSWGNQERRGASEHMAGSRVEGPGGGV